jgi:hypothetical protein
MPVLSSRPHAPAAPHFTQLYIPLTTLITTWQFLAANGSQGREQLAFLAGRVVDTPTGPAAQVTSCVLPFTLATESHVTLTSYAQTARILDELETRQERPVASIHTHGDGGANGWGPEHSTIDDHGVALGPEDGVFSIIVPYYALGSPFGFPHQCSVYQRVTGAWQRLTPAERAARVVVHGDTLRFVRTHTEGAPT